MAQITYGSITVSDLTDGKNANIWTTTVAPITPDYTFNISNLTGSDDEPREGDIILYDVYRYTISSISSTTVLAGNRQSLQGAAGTNGGKWYSGTGITGTSTTATIFNSSGVANAVVGDMYLNTSTNNTYRCTVAGVPSVAKWVYVNNIKGSQGISVTRTETEYYRKLAGGQAPQPSTTGSTTIPEYVDGCTYYTRTVTYLSVGDPVKGDWLEATTLTNQIKDAYEAWIAAGIAEQKAKSIVQDSSGVTVAAGINGADVTPGTTSTYGYNTIMAPTYLGLRYNAINLAKLSTTESTPELQFYFPSFSGSSNTPTQGDKGLTLGVDGISFYHVGSNTADAILNAKGLKLVKGGIEAGTKNTANYIYVWSEDDATDHNLSINNSGNKSDWRIIAGNKFGVDKAGNLYSSNAIINGVLTATGGKIGGWNIGTDINKSLYYGNQVPGATTTNLVLSPTSATNTNAIAGSETGKTWFISAGQKFGVDTSGNLYATGATISGKITVGEGSNVSTTTEMKTAIGNAVNDIEVGGRNLIKGTAESKTVTTLANQNWFEPAVYLFSAYGVSQVQDTNNTYLTISYDYSITGVDTAFKLTTALRSSSSGTYNNPSIVTDDHRPTIPTGDSSGHGYFTCEIADDWRTYVTAVNGALLFSGSGNSNANASLTVSNVKVEIGTKATDWSVAPEDVQSEIDAKKSTHTLISSNTSGATYATILGYATEGTSTNFTVASTNGVSVGDTVRIAYKVSDMNGAYVYIVGTATDVNNATNVRITAHGLDTTIIDGGNIITNSIGANQIKANSINATKLAVGDWTNLVTVNENDPNSVASSSVAVSGGYMIKTTASNQYMAFVYRQVNSFRTGDELYVEFYAKAASATTARFTLYGYDSSGTYISNCANNLYINDSSTLNIGTSDTFFSGTVKLSATQWDSAALYDIDIDNYATNKVQIYVKKLIVRRKSGGELIVDGAITADKIHANAIDTSKFTVGTQNDVLNSNVLVGGRNLFGYGSDCSNLGGFNVSGTWTVEKEDGYLCAHAAGALTTTKYIQSKIPFTPKPNEIVTFSAYVKIKNITRGTTNPMCEFYFSGQTINNAWKGAVAQEIYLDGNKLTGGLGLGFDKYISDTKWHHFAIVAIWNNATFTSNLPPFVYFRDCTGDLYVRDIKYERGNKYTDWTPAPEDTPSEIGENLCRGTSSMGVGAYRYIRGHWRASGGTCTNVKFTDQPPVDGVTHLIRVTNTGSSAGQIGLCQDSIPNLKNNEIYTLSAWVRLSTEGYIYCRPIYYDTNNLTPVCPNTKVGTSWQYISYTGTLTGTQTHSHSGAYFYFINAPANAYMEVCGVKLEEGIVPTAWTQAPNDIGFLRGVTYANFVKESNITLATSTTAADVTYTGSDTTSHYGIYMNIPCEPNQAYAVSFYHNAPTKAWQVGIGTDDSSVSPWEGLLPYTNLSTSAGRPCFKVTTLPNSTYIRLYIATHTAGAAITGISEITLVSSEIGSASKTATSYITDVSSAGITIHPSGGTANRMEIDGSSIRVYRNNSLRATYADSVVLQSSNGTYPRTVVSSTEAYLQNASDSWATMNSNGFMIHKGGVDVGRFYGDSVYLGEDAVNKKFTVINSNGLYVRKRIDSSTVKDYLTLTDGWCCIGDPASTRITFNPADTAPYIYMNANGYSIYLADSTGVKVGRYTDSTAANINYSYIKSDGLHVYQANTDVAFFGATARVGTTSGKRFEIKSDGAYIYNGTTQLGYYGSFTRIGDYNDKNVRIDSDGVKVNSSQDNTIAVFGDSARIGKSSETYIYIVASGADAGIKFRTKGNGLTGLTIADFGVNTNTGWTSPENWPKETWYTLGYRSGTKGYYSLISGFNNTATHNASVAFGINNKVYAPCAFAIGINNIIGNSSKTSANSYEEQDIGNCCTAMGYDLQIGNTDNQLVCGYRNTVDNSAQFIVGGGTSSTRYNLFSVGYDRIYHGTHTVPSTTSTGEDGFYLGLKANRWRQLYSYAAVNTASDKKEKDIIGNIDFAKDLIMNLKPIEFQWKKSNHNRIHMGFIAQEAAEVGKKLNKNLSLYEADYIDEFKGEYHGEEVDDKELSWGMTYDELIAPLVKVVQDQQKEIELLKQDIQILKGEKLCI